MWFKRSKPPSSLKPGQRFSQEQVRQFTDYRHRELVKDAADEGFIRYSFIAESPWRNHHQLAMPWEEFHVVIASDVMGLYDTSRFDRPIKDAKSCKYFTRLGSDVRSLRLVEEPREIRRLLGGTGEAIDNATLLLHMRDVPAVIWLESEGVIVSKPSEEQFGPICQELVIVPRSGESDVSLRSAFSTLESLTEWA